MQRKKEGCRNNQNWSCYPKGFATRQCYGKPFNSPSKRAEVDVIIRLVNEVGLKLKESDFKRNWKKKYGELSDKVKSQAIDFYYQIDIISTKPGIKDEIIIYLHKVYAMFKTVYPDSEIGFTIFTSWDQRMYCFKRINPWISASALYMKIFKIGSSQN